MKGIEYLLLGSTGERTTDRALMRSIAVSIFGIVLSLVFLTSATWAWFSGSVSSGDNVIRSANCTVTVAVDGVMPVAVDNDKYSYTFMANQSYEITLTASGTAKSSYCCLLIDNKPYYTEQIPTTGENSISFKVSFGAETKVELVTCWGTYDAVECTFYDEGSYVYPIKTPGGE